MQHRRLHHALRIGQQELDPLVQRHSQRLLALKAPVLKHHGFKVGRALGRCRQGRVKPPPHQSLGLGIVFQKLVVGWQLKLLQHRQRRTAQQRGKPAVESANLHLPTGGQNALI